MVHFECPSCKAKCEAVESTAGMTIACPRCGKPVIVPNQSTATASGGILFRNVVLVLGGLALVGFVVLLAIPNNPGNGPSSPAGPNPVVVMDTSMGAIKVELFADKAPISVANFLKYVDDKYYDGTIFHRVMPGFMIQCGGFLPGMREKPTRESIKNESSNGASNVRGALAMARTSSADSATSQFFINVTDNLRLDRAKAADQVGYAVFGQVVDGMDVVDSIQNVDTKNSGGHEAVPLTDVVIKTIRRVDPN